MVQIGSRVRGAAASLFLAAAAGCLAAPSEVDDPPVGNCEPFVEDSFDDDGVTRSRFDVDEAPPESTVDISGGFARVGAFGSSEVSGYAGLRTEAEHQVASTALEVSFDSGSVSQGGAIILALDTEGETSYELGVLASGFAIVHDDAGGNTTVECDPCADFADGTWTLRLEERRGTLRFLAGSDGGPLSDLFPAGVAIESQAMFAHIFLVADEDGAMATADLDTISWATCE